MSEIERKKLFALDDAAEKAGGYVVNMVDKDVHYDFKKLNNYCKEKGVEPADLPLRELSKFIVP